MSTPETIVKRMVIIDAPSEVIWRALTTQGISSLHLLREAGSKDLQEGNELAWYDVDEERVPHIKGRITVISPLRRIAFMAFMPSEGLPDIPENYTLVDLTLHPEENGRTTVAVEQGDFAQHPHGARTAKQVGNDWVQALIRLKMRVEHEAAA